MSQVSSGQVGVCDPMIHRCVELVKAQTEGVIHRLRIGEDIRQTGADEAGIEACEKESYAPTEIGHLVTMGIWNALDQTM